MPLPRLWIPVNSVTGDAIELSGEPAHRLRRVRRLRPGDGVDCRTGDGIALVAVIEKIDSETVTLRIMERHPVAADPACAVWLLQGLPKGDKPDQIIQKCVELGCASVTFVETEFSVPRMDRTAAAHRLGRWQRIAEQAAEQCGRGRVPAIAGPAPLATALLHNAAAGQKLLLEETGDGPRLGVQLNPQASAITLLVGPEGGFSAPERELIAEAGFVPVSLGPRILRTETAPMAALSVIMDRLQQ